METFQKIIIFTAIIVLIVVLIVIGITLSKAKNADWPPITPMCPDYWIMDGSGNNIKCINIKDLGTCPPVGKNKHLTMNFNIPSFTGAQGDCNKYKWATSCGISWDGITYGVGNPCANN